MMKKEKVKKKTHAENLLENAEVIIEMLESGSSYDDIKSKYGVNYESITFFITTSVYSARAREAQKNSAQKYAQLALEAIKDLKAGQDKAEITKQRELAHHYRWLAKVKSPREFNENRVEPTDATNQMPAITINLTK
jgi:ribosomal protein L3